MSRHFVLNGFTRHHPNRLTPEKARHNHLVDTGWQRGGSAVGHMRRATEGSGHLYAIFTQTAGIFVDTIAVVVLVPVHAGCRVVVLLHAIHTDIAFAGG